MLFTITIYQKISLLFIAFHGDELREAFYTLTSVWHLTCISFIVDQSFVGMTLRYASGLGNWPLALEWYLLLCCILFLKFHLIGQQYVQYFVSETSYSVLLDTIQNRFNVYISIIPTNYAFSISLFPRRSCLYEYIQKNLDENTKEKRKTNRNCIILIKSQRRAKT